jgi:uracil-DNA glycosylase
MISGHGSISASITFIGDGCSDEDISSGYCLTGLVERKFKEYSHEHGISFNDTYRTCLIKDRINLSKPDKNKDLVTDQYRQILTTELNSINSRILVPTSELSFNFTTGLSGIRKFRGSVLPSVSSLGTKRVIPVLGPYPYLNEDPKLEFITRLDFSKIQNNLCKIGPIEEIGICWIAKNAESLRNFFKRHYENTLKTNGFVVLDIETYCGIPTCISFCFDGNESVTAPILDREISIDERVLMLHEISKLLAAPIPKVNQNIKFDWKKLEARLHCQVNNVVGDTLLAASFLYPEFPKNLGFLTSLYTDMPYFKDEGKQFDPSQHNRERLYLYCAKDSLATHKIYSIQLEELKETKTDVVYKRNIRILPIYKTMEENGILIDDTKRKELLAKYETLFDIQVFKLHRLTNTKINPLASGQVRKIVFEELGYTKIRGVKTTTTSQPSTDEESLELLMWVGQAKSLTMDAKAILQTFINCRKLHKVLEYLESPIFPDGRTRCEFNLAGTETGRTTTGKTTDNYLCFDKGKVKLKNLGRSFQNIGKHGFEIDDITLGRDIRAMFVPSPGYCFVEIDLSQAEARVDAVLAEDYDILYVFDGPIGIHRITGSWVFSCEPSEIKKNILVDGHDRYHEAKTVRHAGERNMREDRLMMMIHQPISFCRNVLNIFHKKQPNIREVFHHEIRECLQKTRNLTAPNGRKRDFFGRFDNHMVNEGISFLPQAIVTDYLKDGIDRCFAEPDRKWIRPLSESHDSFFAEVPIPRRFEYVELFQKCLDYEIDFRTCSLPRDFCLKIPSEVEWSDTNWKEMKELK